jgi:hypothetical protein
VWCHKIKNRKWNKTVGPQGGGGGHFFKKDDSGSSIKLVDKDVIAKIRQGLKDMARKKENQQLFTGKQQHTKWQQRESVIYYFVSNNVLSNASKRLFILSLDFLYLRFCEYPPNIFALQYLAHKDATTKAARLLEMAVQSNARPRALHVQVWQALHSSHRTIMAPEWRPSKQWQANIFRVDGK